MNPYYEPQNFGPPLTLVADVDLTGHDRGCSCPVAFEDHTSLESWGDVAAFYESACIHAELPMDADFAAALCA